jgi:hypothetical protein
VANLDTCVSIYQMKQSQQTVMQGCGRIRVTGTQQPEKVTEKAGMPMAHP